MVNVFQKSPKKWKTSEMLWYLFFASILLALSTRFFISIVGTFTPGIAGVAQGMTYTLWNILSNDGEFALGMNYAQFVNNFYFVFNWTLNIPIIVFSFNKVGKRFSLYSIYVMVCTMIITILISNLPGIKEVFSGQYLQELKYSMDPRDQMLSYSIFVLIGLFGGVSYGFACGLVFRAGYSTMGFDPIAKYLELNKGVNINKTLFIFSILSSIFWINVTALSSGHVTSLETFITLTFLSPMMATTIVFIVSYGYVSNITYPSLKKVSIEVATKEYEKIYKELFSTNIEDLKIQQLNTGVVNEDTFTFLSLIVSVEESTDIIKLIRNIDCHSIITMKKIDKVFFDIPIH